jgi:uncharacterized protein (DUF1501 family)
VGLSDISAEDPEYLGPAHRPFKLSGAGVQSLELNSGVTSNRLANRRALLQSVDNLRREIDDHQGTLRGLDSFTAQALEMISSPRARDAFDISKEPEQIRARYGEPGAQLLMARRLVEAGVSVVTTTLFGWDHHQDLYRKIGTALPAFDQAMHALITDLYQRGLDKDVLVIAWGEFGRTPRINTRYEVPGRDHWPGAGFALMAGGGLQMGQIVGETDARGERAKGKPLTPQDVLATMYHVLGIDPALTFVDHSGRPRSVLDHGEKIEALL